MVRSAARKKRNLLKQGTASPSSSAAPQPNGQSGAGPPPVVEVPSGEPERGQDEQAFCEPLQYLADDPASLTSLLRETAAAVSTGPTRLADPRRALLLMRHCAPRLPPAQLAERLTSWCQFLGGLLRAPRQLWCRETVCRTAAVVLAEEGRVEDAHRLLAAGGLAQIVNPLVESAEQATPASLHCLRVVLLHFGRGCGVQRGQMVRFLTQLFDTEQPGVSWAACRCVALLPITGPSGTGGAAYSAAWAGQMRGLICSAHSHLDRLLDGIVELQTFDVPEPGELELDMPDLPDSSPPDPIRQRHRLARRVSAICRVATLMLASSTRQPVSVPVSALLGLAQRCVVAGAASASAALELQAARRAMCDVRAAALRMVEALILGCGVDLLQRGTALNRLLLSSLQPSASPRPSASTTHPSTPRSSPPESGHPSPAAEAAHRQALRTLRAWLVTAGAGCGLQEEAERLVAVLGEDVRPPQPEKVTLQTNPAATNGVPSNPSRKKRRAAADWLESDTSARQSVPPPSRPRRCQAALDALTQLVSALGPTLKVSAHQAIQQLCVGLLLELHQSATPPPPYDRAGCRAGLYRLLRALVADPNPAWPAPVQFATRLFAQGARDPDMVVSMLCQDGQALCSRVVQPTHPTLFFPVDLAAHSKPPASNESAEQENTTDTGQTPMDGGEEVSMPPDPLSGLPRATNDITTVPDDASGAPEGISGSADNAEDVLSDISECGSSDTVRLGSRLESVTAAAGSAAGDSRTATPPGPSGGQSNQTSPRTPAGQSNQTWPRTPHQTPGSSGGRSPAEQKPPTSWQTGRNSTGDGLVAGRNSTGGGGEVTTVTIASSESSAEADGRRSVELAEMEEDQKSIVLGGSEDGEEERGGQGERRPHEEEDEVEILETKRPRRDTVGDEDLAPDVADMLKDFVNEDPEVE